MIQSQINILNSTDQFNYYIEYVNDIQYTTNSYSHSIIQYYAGNVDSYKNMNGYKQNPSEYGVLFFRSGSHNIYKNVNDWSDLLTNRSFDYIPDYVDESSLNIYFPQWSVETYDNGGLYNIAVYTYINGLKVCLGSYLINRKDAIAVPSSKRMKGIDYKEYINIKIIDPWKLCYSDEWMNWRNMICGESKSSNSEGSLLTVELTPVVKSGDKYILKSPYVGGSSNILLSNKRNDILYTRLSFVNDYFEEPCLNVLLDFNSIYEGDFATYMIETYGLDISQYKSRIELVMKTDEDMFKYISKDMEFIDGKIQTCCNFTKADLDIKDWSEYVDGASLVANYIVYDPKDDEEVFSSMSDELPFIPEIFKFLIKTDIDFINLEHISMHNFHVDVVNKINKNIIAVNKPDDYKANILKPIFVQSYQLGDINIHPRVTESICINLNQYKQKVNIFYIRIEGIDFVEIGRTSNGVVFKIVGTSLPNEYESGVYYILNEDKELVTTGNYNYIQ